MAEAVARWVGSQDWLAETVARWVGSQDLLAEAVARWVASQNLLAEAGLLASLRGSKLRRARAEVYNKQYLTHDGQEN